MTNYHDVRDSICNGDVGLVRDGGNPISRLIAMSGRGNYSHAFPCAWRNSDQDTLLAAESREGRGGQLVTLSSVVRRYPRLVDIWRPTFDCPIAVSRRAATIAVNWSGHRYNYPGLARIAIAHRPELRWLAEKFCGARFNLSDTRPSRWDAPKFCSQLVAWSYRQAVRELGSLTEWDPCPRLGDAWVEPSDLARGGAFELLFEGLIIDEDP